MPVGDIQWSGDRKDVALGMLKRHIQWGVDRGAYFIGMGDYIDSFSPSNRQRLVSAALYDSALKSVDQLAERYVEEVYEEALAPSRGRWLGLLEGHHYHALRDGTTTDQQLSRMLDAPFLGSSAYVRLALHRVGKHSGNSQGQRGSVLIYATHGDGGGARAGSPLNKVDMWPATRAGDIFLMGHVHKKVVAPVDYIEPVFSGNRKEPRLIHRTKILATTGSFMKGYVVGRKMGQVPRGAYPEQKNMPPVALGGVLVKIRPRWTEDGFVPDLSVEA